MKKTKNNLDFMLSGACGALIIFGILILSSISATLSYEKFGNPFNFFSHQIFRGLIPGLVLAFFAYRINPKVFKKISPWLFLGNLFLMGLIFFPGIGVSSGGATRWLGIGSFSFQPAEFLKLTFI